MSDGRRDARGSSTREESAGVAEFDERFAWTPEGRPVSLLVYAFRGAAYAVGGAVALVLVVILVSNAAALGGVADDVSAPEMPDISVPDFQVPDLDFGSFTMGGGSNDRTATDTPTDATGEDLTETATPTRSPTATATATDSPTPTAMPTTPTQSTTPTLSGTATPTETEEDDDFPSEPDPTATATLTATPTPSGPPNYAVTIDSTNSPIAEGEDLEVKATVENTGGSQGEQTVVLNIDGSQKDSKTITLAPGKSTQKTFTWSTSSGDAGDYSAEVASDNKSDSTDVSVRQPPEITQFDTTANCGLVEQDAVLQVEWGTSNADDVLVEIIDPDGNVIFESNEANGDSGNIEDAGGCGSDYTFAIEASNSVGSTSDSTTKTAGGS